MGKPSVYKIKCPVGFFKHYRTFKLEANTPILGGPQDCRLSMIEVATLVILRLRNTPKSFPGQGPGVIQDWGNVYKHKKNNVAVGKETSQSSTLDGRGNPNHANDGSLKNHFPSRQCSHTKKDFEPWWMVDLSTRINVSSVLLTNRGDCCGERLHGAEVKIGDSAENGGKSNPSCGTVPSENLGATISLDCKGMLGQYVSVVIPGRREFLSLCEVQVLQLVPEDSALQSSYLSK
ncbi:fucolectin-2-like [Tachyglossus aculeatus]|uniref:fucolectin-2-like n=1 Tax=Tachyglossus aculeatus TaxID=9261 RepID=UPI0018F55DEC|nr:fucolectin-2-like [Tachyglossus aculeatus]